MARIYIGQVLLNQFRVDAFLDAGGMGAVYKVWDIKRQVPLAMKVLHDRFLDEPGILKRFRREAKALATLTHPNIVPFYGLYQAQGFAFLLEAYIDGPTLQEILKKQGRLTVKEALTVLKGVSAALHYAHAHHVVHCDVKPSNVMVDRGGRVYLADFGIARHAESTTTTLGFAGTPAYMAPEQFLEKPVSPATDVYALGVMAYELLVGRKPFTGTEPGTGGPGTSRTARLQAAHLKLAPPDPRQFRPSLPQAVAAVLLRALAKSPKKRYPNAWAFFTALCKAWGTTPARVPDRLPPPTDITDEDPTTTLPPQPTSSSPSRAPARARPSWLVWGAALAVIGLFVSLATGLAIWHLTNSTNTTAPQPAASNATAPPASAPNSSTALPPTTESREALSASPLPAITAAPTTPPSPTAASMPSSAGAGLQGQIAFEFFTHTWNVDIYLANTDGSHQRPLLQSDANERYPALSRDGRYLAYASDQHGTWDIYVLDIQTREQWRLTSWERTEWYPAWSPDGHYLVFSSNYPRGGNDFDLYLVSWPDGKISSLTSGRGVDNLPSWSPDGQWIAFQRALSGKWWIVLVRPDGTQLHELLQGKSPDWSPDGKRLVFSALSAGDNRDIYLYDFTTHATQRLTTNTAKDQDPCWAADGHYIIFESNRTGRWNLFRVTADGSQLTQITHDPQDEMTAACGP